MKLKLIVVLGLALIGAGALAAAPDGEHWVATWVTSQQLTEPQNKPPAPGLAHTTLRQVIQPSIGGARVRVSFSNAFGNAPLVLTAAHLARSAGGSAIVAATDRALTFHGAAAVTIQPGGMVVSDPAELTFGAFENLAVTVVLPDVPGDLTGHPGSRTTSFYQAGDAATAADLSAPLKVDHWYFVTEVDVWADAGTSAVVALGDSITDGRGSTTNQNNRWPDQLAHRLRANPATAKFAVVNQGIGGNRLLRDGLGPNALARFDRDVLAPAGVRTLIVLESINDLGTAAGARAKGQPAATAADLIAALEQIATRAHTHGIRVLGATILPYEGCSYFSPQGEADRQAINTWIRTSGVFDGVVDFDAVTRDPAKPSHLSAAIDGGDHLHPSAAGYQRMAEAVDLALFTAP